MQKAGEPDTEIMTWREDEGWRGFTVEWPVRCLALGNPNSNVMAGAGLSGLTFYDDGKNRTEELIDETEEGPRFRGNITDLVFVDSTLYAVGMSRQVYCKKVSEGWKRIDQGVVQELGGLDIVGFNSLHGLDGNLLLAAGYGGEIWIREQNSWRRAASPTKVVLAEIMVAEPGRAYACGQQGTILKGRGDRWEIVSNTVTQKDFWGMAYFQGQIFLATDRGLYSLDEFDDLKEVRMPFESRFTCRHLHSDGGALYSFGSKHIACTLDGKNWVDRTPENL